MDDTIFAAEEEIVHELAGGEQGLGADAGGGGAQIGADRQEAALDRVAQQDEASGQALGVGGTDVVLGEDLEHPRPGEARDVGGEGSAEGEAREEQVLGRAVACDREQRHQEDEEDHQESSDHEVVERDACGRC